MVVTVRSLGLNGVSGYEVSAECFLSGGLPAFDIVGLPDAAVREAVLKKVTSPNWYVRTKAISYLHRWGLTKEQIFDILYLRDKYADNALLYQYRNEKELSHYIIDTMQLLQRQDEAVEEAVDEAAGPLPV